MKTDSNINSEVKSAFERWMVAQDVRGRLASVKIVGYNIMRLTDDISKAEEIYLSQMAAKDA